MANEHVQRLETIWATLHRKNICTLNELLLSKYSNEYAELWEAADSLVGCVAFRSNLNRGRISDLGTMGVTADDIRHTVLVRIIEKIGQVLAKPPAVMLPYCYTLVSTQIIDAFRKQMQGILREKSMDGTHNAGPLNKTTAKQRIFWSTKSFPMSMAIACPKR